MKLRCLAVALALLGVSASDSWGQSQEPPTQSKEAAQPPTLDKRGTDDIPLAIKIISGPDAKEQADKAEHERKEKAVIDEKLAFETQRIADYTERLALFTLLLFGIAVLQAGFFLWQLRYMRQGMRDTEIAANAGRESANVAARTLIASQRPWVSAKIELVGPMTFDASGGYLPLRYILENSGPSPALNVSINPRIILNSVMMEWQPVIEGGMPLEPVRAELRSFSELTKAAYAQQLNTGSGELFFPGDTIFPRQTIVQTIRLMISGDEIANALEAAKLRWEQIAPGTPASPSTKTFVPAITTCVTYTSEISKAVHQTGLIFGLVRIDPLQPGENFAIDPLGSTIDLNNLRLDPWFFGGGFAT